MQHTNIFSLSVIGWCHVVNREGLLASIVQNGFGHQLYFLVVNKVKYPKFDFVLFCWRLGEVSGPPGHPLQNPLPKNSVRGRSEWSTKFATLNKKHFNFQFFIIFKSPITAVFARYGPLARQILLYPCDFQWDVHVPSKSFNNDLDSSHLRVHVARLVTSTPSHSHCPEAKWGEMQIFKWQICESNIIGSAILSTNLRPNWTQPSHFGWKKIQIPQIM